MKAPRSLLSPLVLLQHPAPAFPGDAWLWVAPGRAVQPQLLALAKTLGACIDLHPRRLCTGRGKKDHEQHITPWHHLLPG